ncbi:MAG: transcriptional repressor [Tannerella sp.]|jgi:Fe2+ or Zn2+ uptake regulation protein|nr:transcriptional repressor [Tannerella sp.]
MDTTSQYLSGYGIRPSVQRIAIMRYLKSNRTHPTADEIFEALRMQIPTLSKTTVYNTLKLFVEQGAAIYIGIDEKNARFDGYVEPHAHFRCKICGKIIDLEMNMEDFLPRDFRGQIDESYFYIKGICEDCNRKNN